MKSDIWMPLYIGDYAADTLSLSLAEHGAYLLALMAYWRKRGPLTQCEAESIMREHCPSIARFFQVQDGIWRHKRVEAELAIANQRSDHGRRAARAKWDARAMPEHTPSNARTMPKACPSQSPSQSPSPSPDPKPKDISVDPCAPRTPRPKFEIPSLEQVKLHAAKIGLSETEAVKFIAHYESNGWRVGRNPMKSWPAAMTNWKLNFQSRTYQDATARPNGANGSGPGGAAQVAMGKELDRITERIQAIRGGYSGLQDWSGPDRAEIANLKVRASQIKHLLGIKY